MAILKIESDFNLKPLKRLLVLFPDLSGRLLALIGKRSRTLLREKYLSGQELNLKAGDRDKSGKYMISSEVNKSRTQTKIYSYPVNLFERGRLLRSGRKEAGKYIITKKLKQDVMMRVGGYVREFENKILRDEIRKAGI